MQRWTHILPSESSHPHRPLLSEPDSKPIGLFQECVISSLLSQKKDIKRQTMLLERMQEQEATDIIAARLAARERVLQEFEQTQTGLSATGAIGQLRRPVAASTSTLAATTVTGGVKRKFDLDSTEIERLAKESEDKAAKKIALELVESRKAKLPNFWLVRCIPMFVLLIPANIFHRPTSLRSLPMQPLPLYLMLSYRLFVTLANHHILYRVSTHRAIPLV